MLKGPDEGNSDMSSLDCQIRKFISQLPPRILQFQRKKKSNEPLQRKENMFVVTVANEEARRREGEGVNGGN